jgi:hypothetical protein
MVESVSEIGPKPMQAGSYCSSAETEHLADLGAAQVLPSTQDEQVPILGGEGGDRSDESSCVALGVEPTRDTVSDTQQRVDTGGGSPR